MEDGTYILNANGTLDRVVHRDGYYVGVEPYGEDRPLSEGEYIGVWTDPASAYVYKDVSEHIEHIEDRATALAVAELRRELAIWDVARGVEILTSHGLQARVDAGKPFDIIVGA